MVSLARPAAAPTGAASRWKVWKKRSPPPGLTEEEKKLYWENRQQKTQTKRREKKKEKKLAVREMKGNEAEAKKKQDELGHQIQWLNRRGIPGVPTGPSRQPQQTLIFGAPIGRSRQTQQALRPGVPTGPSRQPHQILQLRQSRPVLSSYSALEAERRDKAKNVEEEMRIVIEAKDAEIARLRYELAEARRCIAQEID